MSAFLSSLSKKNTTTWNGAISNSSSGSSLLDYFAKCGSYRGRTQPEVDANVSSIFGEDEKLAMKMVLYNRMITRKAKGFVEQTENVQRGQGQRDEFVKTLKWLEVNRPSLLKKNLWLVPEVGCWKDLWYDSPLGFYHYTNTKMVYPLIKRGLSNEVHRGLLAKYLPKIRSKSNTKNDRHKRLNVWARNLCTYLKWSETDYRKFKSNPENTAHLWQRFMSDNAWNKIDFNQIPGKALFKMVSSKKNLLNRHNLENKYQTWVDKQPVVKFNGYPYELLLQASSGNRTAIQTSTYNKQFEQLLATAKDNVNPELLKKGVWCALDTSGSMGCLGHYGYGYTTTTLQPIHICVGLGIYFSSLIEGAFKDHVIMFDSVSRAKRLTGTFCDKVAQIPANAMGSTNFQSVIDEIVRIRRDHPEIPVEDYPEVLLVVSDMQFNPSGSHETNYETAMRKLRPLGLPDMTIIWWNVNGRYSSDVPSTMTDAGTVLISGMDGAIVSSILSCEQVVDKKTGEKRKATPYEQMVNALDQEILNCVKV